MNAIISQSVEPELLTGPETIMAQPLRNHRRRRRLVLDQYYRVVPPVSRDGLCKWSMFEVLPNS